MDECVSRMIFVELLNRPSIEHRQIVALNSVPDLSWMDPVISFLTDGSLPTKVEEAKKVQTTSSQFWLSKDKKLYQRSFGGPYLLCLHPNVVANLFTKLHERVCGSHSRGRLLSHQART